MRILSLVFFLFVSSAADAQPIPKTVVRIKSHGASAVVIQSKKNHTWILGCGHMFWDKNMRPSQERLNLPLVMDGPRQPNASTKRVRPIVVAVDFKRDLSLIYLANGPFYTIPVAPRGHKIGRKLISAGYDNMRWPITCKWATNLGADGTSIFTIEKPWHGRSGGALVDNGKLVGIVQGYETIGRRRGIYVSLEQIWQFMIEVKAGKHKVKRIQKQQPIRRPPSQIYRRPQQGHQPPGGC